MAITDLTGYIWTANDVLTDLSVYGDPMRKIWDFDFYLGSDSDRYYTGFYTGKYTDSSGYYYYALLYGFITEDGNDILIAYDQNADGSGQEWRRQNYRIMHIIGGTDSTNADLISWLQENGTLMPASEIGETWLLNDVPLTMSPAVASVLFVSNGTVFQKLAGSNAAGGYLGNALYLYVDSTGETQPVFAYSKNSGWTSQAYRTITLDEPATGDFLTWLQANAVKQQTEDPDYLIKGSTLNAIGDAIRGKTGETEELSPEEMASEITDELVKPSGTKSITENGTVDVSAYASANVNVPSGEGSIFSTFDGGVEYENVYFGYSSDGSTAEFTTSRVKE